MSFILYLNHNIILAQQRGRFRTSNITEDQRMNCYLTTLTIKDVLPRDSVIYYVSMENGRGKTKFGVRLMVSFLYLLNTFAEIVF